jgi:type II secretory pathway pseudopilin PulG
MTRAPSMQAGFTLVELMFGMILTGLAVTAALAAGISLKNGFIGQRRAVQVERTARAVTDMITSAVRAASPGVGNGAIQDLVGCSTFQGISVVNGGTTAPDELTVVWGASAVTSLRAPYTTTTTALTVLDGSNFRPGDYAVVTDLNQGHLVKVTNVQQVGGNWQLTTGAPNSLCGVVTFPAGNVYPDGSLVIRARMAHFYIDASAAVGYFPTLMMDPDGDGPAVAEPVAPGVEDLQIAVGVDVNNDGEVSEVGLAPNDDEWFYNVAGDAPPPAITGGGWRALRVTVTVRSLAEVSSHPISTRPAVEDRVAASQPDEFRRRTLSTTVEIRNLQGSP